MFTRDDARGPLRDNWGYDSFRPMQEEIVMSVLEGRDTLGLMPTGGGKSITFQVPALMLDGLTVVVTPLISLMKDQVDNLRARGIKALYLFSGLTRHEQQLAIERCMAGRVKILYVSPEKLSSRSFADTMRQLPVSLIVVDEAHCISQWGYDFRPSYLKIRKLREFHPEVPVLALTASATPDVADDISRQLEFREGARRYTLSFSRENLSYVVRDVSDKDSMLLRVVTSVAGTAIVYVRSRRRTREIAQMLNDSGVSAEYYHAGLDARDKNERQNRWKEGTSRVMVATNAFGMGIDKPDVRLVVHYDLPSSLEEYYQEAGRAGRDGLPSFAVVLASKTDKALLTRRVNEAFPPKDMIRRVYELAGNFLDVAVGGGYNQVYEFNFPLFCKRFDLKPVIARNALVILTRAGYVDYTDEIATRSRIMVTMQRDELYCLELPQSVDRVFQLILRTYTGLFADYEYISESLLASRLGVKENEIYESLLTLSRMHVINYVPRTSTPYLYYTTSREEPRHIITPAEVYEKRRRQMEQRVEAMKHFVFASDRCRAVTMLRYFGEKNAVPCGKCDWCRAMRRAQRTMSSEDSNRFRDALIAILRSEGCCTIDFLVSRLGVTTAERRDQIIAVVRDMADNGLAELDGLNVRLSK